MGTAPGAATAEAASPRTYEDEPMPSQLSLSTGQLRISTPQSADEEVGCEDRPTTRTLCAHLQECRTEPLITQTSQNSAPLHVRGAGMRTASTVARTSTRMSSGGS